MHIFREITIQNPARFRKFVGIMKRNSQLSTLIHKMEIRPEYNAAMLLEAVEHLLAPRLTNLSTLIIQSHPALPTPASLGFGHSVLRTVTAWLRRRQRYPHPPETYVDLRRAPHWLGSRFGCVTTLKLCKLQFVDAADFGAMLCAFPNLSTLHCVEVIWFQSSTGHPFPARALKGVTNLHLYTTGLWLFGCEDLMVSTPTSLSKLALSADLLPPHRDLSQSISRLKLERFASLVELHLICSKRFIRRGWISNVLTHIQSPVLRRVKIQIPFMGTPDGTSISERDFWHQLSCNSIDEVLSRPSFSGLREVVFAFDRVAETSHDLPYRISVKLHLPKLNEKRMLRVIFSDRSKNVS
ncbi:hypothetical protein CERSUDRAFT_110038 [Gelatoporia subvermispora B]|uniref:F-box domain-containing protein n=1 Tax=Ceriporiopsis subvermispora (strain B) TaxID=914234 RepID=M2QWJ8_CERS8|nr:hypothetical protein CERSUDRAFT_110038 [Gelatoporia subvermispora B]